MATLDLFPHEFKGDEMFYTNGQIFHLASQMQRDPHTGGWWLFATRWSFLWSKWEDKSIRMVLHQGTPYRVYGDARRTEAPFNLAPRDTSRYAWDTPRRYWQNDPQTHSYL